MPDTGNAGMTIGDCAVQFIADMTQLDAGVDSLGPRIQAGMSGAEAATGRFGDSLDDVGEKASEAGLEVEEAGQLSAHSMSEARGEVALLGEEFGIRLPRHVRSFVAELPGVGEALSAAFSATAALFLIEALVKGTEKLTEFIGSALIFTDAMRAADAATAMLDKTITDSENDLDKASKAFDRVHMSASQLANIKIDESLKEKLKGIDDDLAKANALLEVQPGMWATVLNSVVGFYQGFSVLQDKLAGEFKGTWSEALKLAKGYYDGTIAADEKAAIIRNNIAQAAIARSKEEAAADKEHATQNIIDADAAQAAWLKAANDRIKMAQLYQDNAYSNSQIDAKEAADAIAQQTLLNKLLEEGRKIKDESVNSGADKASIEHVKDLVKALKDAGKELDQLESKMEPFAADFNSAFISAATGAESWAKAMSGAVGSALKSLGQWCQTKMLENVALAAENWENPGPYLLAAAGFEAAALACGVAGAEMSSGGSSGGGGGSYSGTGTTGNVTSGSGAAPGPQTTTTRLYAGGLVSGPTMAIIGDTASGGPANEAVLPLDNPEVMQKLASHFAAAMQGGGGGNNTIHHTSFGQLRHSDLKRLTKQINQAVNKGTATLNSTKTGRVVKRSA